LTFAQAGKQVVSVAPPRGLTAKRGGNVTGSLNVTIQPGYHVNSDKPKDEFLIPLKLTWTSGPLVAREVLYPSPEQVKVGSDTLDVFTGTFAVKTEFTVPQHAAPGMAMMVGTLHYQACDSQSCKRPASVSVQAPVTIQ
jgi:Disulphide bond corrector protein DsbC